MDQIEAKHYLTFEFKEVDQKFVYTVTEDVKNSVHEELLGRDWETNSPVIEFKECSGRKISVNARYVRRCQALFDTGLFPAKDQAKTDPGMMIIIDGMTEPLYYNDIESDEALHVASVMVGVDSDSCEFVSFTDEDGEVNLIRADKVMLLERSHYKNEFEEDLPQLSQTQSAATRSR